MAMTNEEVYELIRKISETGGDTDDMLEDLKKLKDEFDERDGMLKALAEKADRTEYTDDDVRDKDGVTWREKYDNERRRYRDRFLTSEYEIKEEQVKDIFEDDTSNFKSFDELFETREGNYE